MKMLQKRAIFISMVTVFQLQGALTEGDKDWSYVANGASVIKTGCKVGMLVVEAHAILNQMPLQDYSSGMPLSAKIFCLLVAGHIASDAVVDYARSQQLQELRAHIKSQDIALGEHSNRLNTIDNGLKDQTEALGRNGTGLTAMQQRLDTMEPTVAEWQRLRDERAQHQVLRPGSSAAFDDITAQVMQEAFQSLQQRPGSQRSFGAQAFATLEGAAGNTDNGDNGEFGVRN